MTKLAVFGAGGKMGRRLARNLVHSDFYTVYVEISDYGRKKLFEEVGVECVDVNSALIDVNVVILAVPDQMIEVIANEIIDLLPYGAMIMCLDAAAPFAGHLPSRKDVSYFVSHPCHPPIFNDETSADAKRDHFGGVAAKQAIVNSLIQGSETDYLLGDKVAKTIYAPVMRSHRLSLESMALLEPGLSETVCASLLSVMKDAMDEVISRGVPPEAARDFLLGHMNILGAVIFDQVDGMFSEACNKAIQFGKPMLMRDDWKRVFELEEISASIKRIT